MLGSAAKKPLRGDRQSRTLRASPHLSRIRSHGCTTESHPPASKLPRPRPLPCPLLCLCSLAAERALLSLCLHNNQLPSCLSARRGSATCTTFPLASCLSSVSVRHRSNILFTACTIIPPCLSRAPSQPAAKLGCNTGLQRSLCPSLHLSRTIRPARSGAAFSSLTPPAQLSSPTIAHLHATGPTWIYLE